MAVYEGRKRGERFAGEEVGFASLSSNIVSRRIQIEAPSNVLQQGKAGFEALGVQYILEVVEEIGDSFPLRICQDIIVVDLGAAYESDVRLASETFQYSSSARCWQHEGEEAYFRSRRRSCDTGRPCLCGCCSHARPQRALNVGDWVECLLAAIGSNSASCECIGSRSMMLAIGSGAGSAEPHSWQTGYVWCRVQCRGGLHAVHERWSTMLPVVAAISMLLSFPLLGGTCACVPEATTLNVDKFGTTTPYFDSSPLQDLKPAIRLQ